MTPLDAQPTRYLLQAGTPVRGSLDRLLQGAHRAGFLILPEPSTVTVRDVVEHAPADPDAPLIGTAARKSWRFELDHRDYPRGRIALLAAQARYLGAHPFTTFEITLDLKHGPPLLLERLVNLIEFESSFVPARLSDEERALQAAGVREPHSRSAPGSHLNLESRWQDLGIAHLKALAAQLHYHEPRAAEALDPEGVHQMRVAARRLREVLRIFNAVLPEPETQTLTDDLRWIGRLLGVVRDLDVQLQRLDRYTPADREPSPTLTRYRAHLQRRHRAAHASLVDALASSRLTNLHRTLQLLVTHALAADDASVAVTIAEAAPPLLDRLVRRVLRSGRRATAGLSATRLHALRIRAKRLRYFLECIEPVGGPDIAAGVTALEHLQDLLGEHQDAWTARVSLSRFRSTASSGRERKTLGRLIARETDNQRVARRRLRTEWPRFARHRRSLILC